jgi:hypothetical protein
MVERQMMIFIVRNVLAVYNLLPPHLASENLYFYDR